ncbi:glutathione peroxidase 3-like [Uloborus diversus]|uniref:glutathione peroxidase 3-like n=1 Tax=Uloborus diversus TaxID=327109 RepID=UPI00240A60CD|nr:glutathione peroxidase 3-like [Uloborus diversus]
MGERIPTNSLEQEPGGNGAEILNGIRHVRPGNGFEPNFQLFKKTDINGEKEHPLYTFLKKLCPPTRDQFYDQKRLFYTPMKTRDVRWNFEKFLVDRHGMPIMRYDPSTEPNAIARDIEYLLSQDT